MEDRLPSIGAMVDVRLSIGQDAIWNGWHIKSIIRRDLRANSGKRPDKRPSGNGSGEAASSKQTCHLPTFEE